MSEWRPIETAPKDGSDILVFHPESREQFVVFWQERRWYFSPNGALKDDPSHWMPLPEPPKTGDHDESHG